MNQKKRILSGITPSGNLLHIGNYFGAVLPQIKLQDDPTFETYYFVADLHALTTVQERGQLEDNVKNVILDYLALGLDPTKCVFFRQSQIPAHAQLAVILGNYVSYGQMQRMHAFKDKLQKKASQASINMGLFNYPILMAADILLYKPYGVPVGEDQRQHVELTRDIAENFNKTYNVDFFPLPEPIINQTTGKIIGTDGQRKMSKSLNNIVSIFDRPAVIERQIMHCYTDPNRARATDPGQVAGNPVFVYHDLINDSAEEVAELKARYQVGRVSDVEVKQRLLAAHRRLFQPLRLKRSQLAADLDYLTDVLAQGRAQAGRLAAETLDLVVKQVGLTKVGF